ncbi:HD domain-containing protein [Natronoglomus mannanivorans]|uniref:HD domain-containing protein n=1 Tax=Natronoglomus mannanivorans TaxID=2979990 RepID=A0AAP2Z4Y3_9EURY|nr:HD domain-containing protein [Halobacteria archaeon AArc-xg1-1]
MNDLERAIRLATEAYAGQTDKAGETYIRHPLRLMSQMETETERIVAVLHDVVEDSDYELEDIEDRFGETVRDAVDALTKRDGESYDDAISRAGANTIARRVKIADLEDNMDITRLESFDSDASERLEKYYRSWKRLQEMSFDNPSADE